MAQDSGKAVTVSGLIEMQRRLAGSGNLFDRLVGTLWAAGMVAERLARLTDRQIGQLMFDHFGHDLGILLPEATVCQHATRRLFRSAGGSFTREEMERQRHRAACPKCGSQMLFRYGVDEADVFECVLLRCGHKELLSV